MNEILDGAVLVLNRSYQPVRVTTVRRAFTLMVRGVAQALDDSGDVLDFRAWKTVPVRLDDQAVRTVRLALRVPRVLRLVLHDRVPRAILHLSSRNVMIRDQFQCQYCGAIPGPDHLNIDHVVPRSRGGQTTWENLVTSCRPCNLRKGGRTPDECGMRLCKLPSRPRWSIVYQSLLASDVHYKAWEPFLRAG